MKSSNASKVLVVATVVAAILSGCSNTPDDVPAAADGPVVIDLSQNVTLATVDEVAAQTEEAAVVTAGSATIEVIDGLPFTVTTVLVTEALTDGVVAGNELRIRQTGQADEVEVASGPNLLIAGQSYAVTLMRFHFVEGDDTGQWRIVGDGLWTAEEDGELSLDADQSTLPATTTVDQLEAAVSEL